MAFNIGSIGSHNYPPENHHAFNQKKTTQPDQQLQQLLQQLSQAGQLNPNQQQLQQFQGSGQDAMVSFSPEAMETLAAQNMTMQQPAGPPPGPNPAQLEQQIKSGDMEAALSTIEQMDAARPSDGNDPNQALKAQLKTQVQQGDQEGAEETLQQLKANRPPGPPPRQAQ